MVTEIWEDFSNKLLNYIKSKVKNEYDAEDILHDVFIKLYLNIDKLDDQTKVDSWLFRITKNSIIDFYRKKKDLIVDYNQLEEALKGEEETSNMNEGITKCLNSMIFDLPEKYRESINLYELEGMKHRDISNKLNISLSASKTRVQRARTKLKEIITECCNVEVDAFGNIVEYQQKTCYTPKMKCNV